MYSSNFTVSGKTCCLSLHYNGDNSYLFVDSKEVIRFNAKDFELITRISNVFRKHFK